MGPEYVEPIRSENFGHLPWAEWDPQTFDPSNEVPTKYYNEMFNAYTGVCGDNTVIAASGTRNGFVETTPFIGAYANYASSFKSESFLRRISYLFSWNKTRWVTDDFTRWLAGGRRCPEGTPGFEKFVPQQSSFPNPETGRRVTTAMSALMRTALFSYDREASRITLDETIMDLDPASRSEHNRLARNAGFTPITSQESPGGIFENSSGDILVSDPTYMFWESAGRNASFGVIFRFGSEESITGGETALLVRNGGATDHPLFERHTEIERFINRLADDPSYRPNLAEALAVFGYTFTGDMTDEHFAKYQKFVGTLLDTSSFREDRTRLRESSAINYYLAVAAFLVTGDITNARIMMTEMSHSLLSRGSGYYDAIRGIEKAIDKISMTSRREPPSASGAAGGGDMFRAGEMGRAEVPGGAAMSILPENGLQYGAETAFNPYFAYDPFELADFRAIEFAY